jgi:hypothetical protein
MLEKATGRPRQLVGRRRVVHREGDIAFVEATLADSDGSSWRRGTATVQPVGQRPGSDDFLAAHDPERRPKPRSGGVFVCFLEAQGAGTRTVQCLVCSRGGAMDRV